MMSIENKLRLQDKIAPPLQALTRLYEGFLLAGIALTPLIAIWYLTTFSPTPALRFEDHSFHEIVIAFATLVGGFVTYVSWRSYQASGEIFLRWLTVGFLVFTLIYTPHGLLTRTADHNIWLFLLYGPVSRLAMLGCFLYGLLQYGKPPEKVTAVTNSGFWWRVLIACAVVDAGVAVLAYSPIAGSIWVRLPLEIAAITLALGGIGIMFLRNINSPLMKFFAIALAIFAQAAIAFILAKPWQHIWWLAHAIFAGGFFILSWGVARALLTTRSFALAYSQEKLMRELEQGKAHAETLNSQLTTSLAERKQKEMGASVLREQLAQASKMESIGQLTAGIAHDFNNILGAMMGYSELSRQMAATGNVEAVARYQLEILKSGTRAKDLIIQMLNFSRFVPEKNDAVAAPPALLAPIIKEAVGLLRASLPRAIHLHSSLGVDELKACIQPVQLHQIILNLGGNARDAMGEYGRLDISLSRHHSEQQLCSSCKQIHTGDYAKLSIKDSGSGIPAHVQDKIFEPFFSTKGVGKGSGLGLSVVHGLVHSLGGHIHLESNPESGTVFNIMLPLAESDAPVTHKLHEDERAHNIRGLRIMVVDDEQAMLSMLNEFLKMQGADVLTFISPMLALEAYKQDPVNFDVIVTDETMPGMSGMHMAEALLKINPAQRIILCTGYSENATPELADQKGIAGFFYKPLNMDLLLLKIHSLCSTQLTNNPGTTN